MPQMMRYWPKKRSLKQHWNPAQICQAATTQHVTMMISTYYIFDYCILWSLSNTHFFLRLFLTSGECEPKPLSKCIFFGNHLFQPNTKPKIFITETTSLSNTLAKSPSTKDFQMDFVSSFDVENVSGMFQKYVVASTAITASESAVNHVRTSCRMRYFGINWSIWAVLWVMIESIQASLIPNPFETWYLIKRNGW